MGPGKRQCTDHMTTEEINLPKAENGMNRHGKRLEFTLERWYHEINLHDKGGQ